MGAGFSLETTSLAVIVILVVGVGGLIVWYFWPYLSKILNNTLGTIGDVSNVVNTAANTASNIVNTVAHAGDSTVNQIFNTSANTGTWGWSDYVKWDSQYQSTSNPYGYDPDTQKFIKNLYDASNGKYGSIFESPKQLEEDLVTTLHWNKAPADPRTGYTYGGS